MRIMIAMMKHETNTFSPVVTDWARFEAWGAYTGEAAQAAYAAARGRPRCSLRDSELAPPLWRFV